MLDQLYSLNIVGKGGHTPPFSRSTPPFSKIPSFMKIQDVSTIYRTIGKTKILNDSFNPLYVISTLKVS